MSETLKRWNGSKWVVVSSSGTTPLTTIEESSVSLTANTSYSKTLTFDTLTDRYSMITVDAQISCSSSAKVDIAITQDSVVQYSCRKHVDANKDSFNLHTSLESVGMGSHTVSVRLTSDTAGTLDFFKCDLQQFKKQTVIVPVYNVSTITINHNMIDSDLTDYVIAVVLNSNNFDFSEAATDGTDTIFKDMTGTLLKFEKDYYDNTNELAVFHVKIPTVSANTDTQIKMEWGDGGADRSDAENTWDNNYVLVSHMGESLLDSTSNNNDLTNNGTSIIGTGTVRQFASDYITSNDSNSLDLSSFTIQSLHKISSLSTYTGASETVTAKGQNYPNYSFDIYRNSNGKNTYRIYGYEGTSGAGIVPGAIEADTVNRVLASGRYDGNTGEWNIDVDNANETVTNSLTLSSNTENLIIGYRPTKNYFNAIISEYRISNISRSDAWIKADYYNLSLNNLINIS